MLRFLFRLLLPILSFPGIMVHEGAHALCCLLSGTRILEICLFQFSVPVGFVRHERPSNPWKYALITTGPLMVNLSIGVLLGLIVWMQYPPGWEPGWFRLTMAWLAVSVATHAFPSLQDATNLLSELWQRPNGWIARLVLSPLGGMLVLGAFGAWYLMLDVLLGLIAGLALPWWLIHGSLWQ